MSRALYVVAYDVSCRKRWRRIFGLMKRRGAHRQLSVFLVLLDGPARRRLEMDIADIIDVKEDAAFIARLAGANGADFREFGRGGGWPGARLLIV